jgi:hypothetical protein
MYLRQSDQTLPRTLYKQELRGAGCHFSALQIHSPYGVVHGKGSLVNYMMRSLTERFSGLLKYDIL